MAIANANPGWVNGDGLRVKFPADEKVLGTAGTFSAGIGSQHITEFDIDYATVALGTTATNVVILDYHVVLPAGAAIDRIEFQVGTAWASASNTVAINFGLVRTSDFSTIVDADGLVDSLAKTAIDTNNALVRISNEGDNTYVGALLDDAGQVAHDSVVCAFYETEAPTAGTGKLRIFWRG